MPRQPRPQIAGGLYHVYTRGNRGQAIVADAGDYAWMIERIRTEVRRREWVCHMYCVMPNHLHLLIETPQPNLSEGMQQLKGAYALAFNHRHGFQGHLFQGRFGSRVIESDAYLVWVVRYIALNPVEAGLCVDAAAWRWSSYAAMIAAAPAPDFLTTEKVLSLFGADRESAVANLEQYVAYGFTVGGPRGHAGRVRGQTPGWRVGTWPRAGAYG